MDFWINALFSLAVLLVSAGLIVWHARAWRAARRRDLPADQHDYYRRQFRRRIQCSVMLAVLAVAIFVGWWIREPSISAMLFWGGTLLLVVWVGLLAMADILATKYHFARLRNDYIVEQAKLEVQARRLRSLRGNGQSQDRRPGGERRK